MNTAMTRTNGSRSKLTIFGAFFAILAALLLGSVAQTNTASAQEPGRDSAVPLEPNLPEGFLRICKVYEAEGAADQPATTFTFLVEIDNAAPDGVIDDSFYVELSLAEGEKGCSDPFEVPLGAKVTITEILPEGWNNAPGYPKYEWSLGGLNGDASGTSVTLEVPTLCLTAPCNVVVYNREAGPQRIPIRVCKVYLNNEDEVLNPGTIFDFDINGNPFNINAAESETNCKTVWVTVYDLDEDVTITEHLPGTWNSAPGYPKVEMDDNPFDDGNHGASSNSITFEVGQCVDFGRPQLRTHAVAQEFACTVIFYNLEDVPGEDDCIRDLCEPPVEDECEIDCDPPVDECVEEASEVREVRETREEDCGNDEPQCTENCGEPLCAEDCDDTPNDEPGTDPTPEPKAPNTGTGLLVDTATNPMTIAAAGIAVLMATVLIGTAALPKRR